VKIKFFEAPNLKSTPQADNSIIDWNFKASLDPTVPVQQVWWSKLSVRSTEVTTSSEYSVGMNNITSLPDVGHPFPAIFLNKFK
jgi:hypothetical protein